MASLKSRQVGSITILQPKGYLTGGEETEELEKAIAQLNASSAEVRADEATERFLKSTAVDKVSKELDAQISFGKPLESGTGLVVSTSDGHLTYDNTVETRLSRLQNSLRSAVYQVLMGEKL